ncbi:MAG: exo-alpha-sialidase [Gemmatimonadetes bacterium]|nr:exo-alpha-sialidase [Gemmatimonadota bacterium]
MKILCPRAILPMAILVAVSCSAADRDAPPDFVLGAVEFSGPPGSAEPNLFTTSDGRVLMSWHEPTGEETHALRMAVRTQHGWSEPVTVAQDRAFFVNWADFPSVVEQTDGTWVVHWLEKVARPPYAYHVMLSRSTDNGETWSEPGRAHQDLSPTEHGFVSMVPLAEGGVSLLFLDGRSTGPGPDGHGMGPMSVRFNMVSADGKIGSESLVDERACDCCQTALVRLDNGNFVAAYRDRTEEEIRDIAVSRLIDGEWTDPRVVANDNWHFAACPVNGPSLSTAGDDVVLAWFTAPDGDNRVSVAFSRDGAETFGTPIRIDDGNPSGRVDIELLDDGSALVVWLEQMGKEAAIRARRVEASGALGAPWTVTSTSAARRSGFPRLTIAGDEVVFAWTLVGDDGGVRVATAVAVERIGG